MGDKRNKVFFSLPEVCEYLNEAEGTVRSWVAKRLIPCYRRGKRLQFNIQEVEAWDTRRNRRATLEERAAGNAKRQR